MERLAGKVALVTGGASGIGAGISAELAKAGCKVLVTDIQIEKGEAVTRGLGDSARFSPLDVTREADWNDAVALAQSLFGGLDILVNNAGAAPGGVIRMDHESVDIHDLTMKIVASSVWYGTRAVIPAMRARGGGSIINIASIDSYIGVAGFSSFVAAKHAVLGITKSAALELGTLNIRVNAIHPGIIETPGMRGIGADRVKELEMAVSRQGIKRFGRVDEIGKAAVFFASDDSSYCTGSSLLVDGGHIAGRNRELGY